MADPFKDLGFKEHTEEESPSMLESAGRGAAQSASMGLIDEATGAAGGSYDYVKQLYQNPEALQSFLDLYTKNRDESRSAYKTAEETNPGSYLTGELAGALVPGIGGAKAIKGGLSAAAKIANATKTGALAGGAYGFGASEEESLPGLAGETLRGAAIGGLTGGGLSAVGQGIKKGVDYAGKQSAFFQDLIESFKRGKSGEALAGKEGKDIVEKSVGDAAEEVRQDLQSEISRGSKVKTAGLEAADAGAETADVKAIISKYQDKINKLPTASEDQVAEKLTLQNKLDDFKKAVTEENHAKYGETQIRSVKAKELDTLTEPFKQSSALGKEAMETAEGVKTATDITKELKGTLKGESFGANAEEIARGDKIMSAALKAKELLFPAVSGLTDAEKIRIEAKLSKTIRQMQTNTEGGVSARHIVNEALSDIENTNPELFSKIKDKILDRATAYDLAKRMGAESNIQGSLVGTVQGKVLSGSNILGQGVKKLKESKPGQLAGTIKSFISGSTPESLQEMRNSLASKTGPAAKDLEMKLEAAQNASNASLRNALLFSIMQSPAYREMLGISNHEQ